MNWKYIAFAGIPFAAALGFAAHELTQAPSLADVFKQAVRHVVEVKTYKRDADIADDLFQDQGSGVVIAPHVVASNCHVLIDREAATPYVFFDGAKYKASLREVDRARDLCTLDVPNLPAQPARIASLANVAVGDAVYTLGSPAGRSLSFAQGIVSALRDDKGTTYIQTTAAISSGSSGGGLFDARGDLLGITGWIDDGGENLNFAIPAELLGELPTRTTYRAGQALPKFLPDALASGDDARWQLAAYDYDDGFGGMPVVADFIDRQDARFDAEGVTVQWRTRYASAQKADDGTAFDERLRRIRFDCGMPQYQLLESRDLSKGMPAADNGAADDELAHRGAVESGTPLDDVRNAACGLATPTP